MIMIRVHCDKCGKELDNPGALVFSPPYDENATVAKWHLCARCWAHLAGWLSRKDDPANPGE